MPQTNKIGTDHLFHDGISEMNPTKIALIVICDIARMVNSGGCWRFYTYHVLFPDFIIALQRKLCPKLGLDLSDVMWGTHMDLGQNFLGRSQIMSIKYMGTGHYRCILNQEGS